MSAWRYAAVLALTLTAPARADTHLDEELDLDSELGQVLTRYAMRTEIASGMAVLCNSELMFATLPPQGYCERFRRYAPEWRKARDELLDLIERASAEGFEEGNQVRTKMLEIEWPIHKALEQLRVED